MQVPSNQDRAQLRTGSRRLTPVDTADAYGAGVGRALERAGNAAFALGEEFERRATAADVDKADAEYQRLEREILFGRQADPSVPGDEGRQGFLSMRGEDAGANRLRIEQELDAAIADVAGRRRNQASRTAFESNARARREAALTSADRHVMGEVQRVEDEARAARALESRASAIAYYADPAEAEAHINTGAVIVREQADAFGDSPEQAANREKLYRSSAWASIIIRLADEDAAAATALFEQRRGEMTPEDIAQVRGATQAVMQAERARGHVDRLLTESGGDYRTALRLAEGIANTSDRDETIARLTQQANAREAAEARDADDAEERARTALNAGGADAVRAEDRALLIAEGRWAQIIADPTRRGGANSTILRDTFEAISVDDPQRFVRVMSALSGVRSPIEIAAANAEAELEADPNNHVVIRAAELARQRLVDEEFAFEEATGYSRAELRAARATLAGDDYRELRELHEYMLGARPSDRTGRTLIQQAYTDLHQYITPMAERNGLYLGGAPAGASQTQLRTLARQRGAYGGFLMTEARRFVDQHNRAPNPAEMDQIASRVLARGRSGGLFGVGATETYGFEATAERRVTVPFDRIPAGERDVLARRWRSQNPGLPDNAQSRRAMQQWAEGAYADYLQER